MAHPIYVLWAHPRSMSTAIERVMRQRGDLDCAHEPFMYDYYVHRRKARMPHFEVDPTHPVTYAEIRDSLLARAELGPVFFKDMAYYMLPHLLDDDFCGRLTHSFLIRDPSAAILSYHRLDPDLTCEEIGLEAEWRLFAALSERTGEAPPVLEAEAVRAAPEQVLRAWWARLGLEDVEDAFAWSRAETPADWAQVGGWHQSVMRSGGIRPLDARDEDVSAAFAEAAAVSPRLASYLAHHQPFHDRLQAFSLRAP